MSGSESSHATPTRPSNLYCGITEFEVLTPANMRISRHDQTGCGLIGEALVGFDVETPDKGVADDQHRRAIVAHEFDVAEPQAIVMRVNGAVVGDHRVRMVQIKH
jgi:hypothetical protein